MSLVFSLQYYEVVQLSCDGLISSSCLVPIAEGSLPTSSNWEYQVVTSVPLANGSILFSVNNDSSCSAQPCEPGGVVFSLSLTGLMTFSGGALDFEQNRCVRCWEAEAQQLYYFDHDSGTVVRWISGIGLLPCCWPFGPTLTAPVYSYGVTLTRATSEGPLLSEVLVAIKVTGLCNAYIFAFYTCVIVVDLSRMHE